MTGETRPAAETDTWRCFVAVPIPEELRSALAAAVEEWRRDPRLAALRWSDPAGWHVTLAFIGAVQADRVAKMEAILRPRLEEVAPFEVASGGLGGFPSARAVQVLWYGLADPERRLAALARRVRDGLGLEEERRFRPHLTLARSRDPRGGPRLTDWLRDRAAPVRRVGVDRVVTYRSHLSRGPARYEPLFSIRLRDGDG